MAFSAPKKGAIMAEINITPLTDIFLVLLIIFMVSSAAMVESGAKISLPEVDATSSTTREITISVTPTQEIYVNNVLTAYEDIEGALRDLLAANPEAMPRSTPMSSVSAGILVTTRSIR